MALKSTVFKDQLQIADIDNAYYADHALTLARHPSETDERMMVRLAALSLNAFQLQNTCQGDGVLAFGAGLSDPDDPDVSLTDFTGRKRLWIEVGQPDEKTLQRASSQSDHVLVYAFSSSADIWWKNIENKAPFVALISATNPSGSNVVFGCYCSKGVPNLPTNL